MLNDPNRSSKSLPDDESVATQDQPIAIIGAGLRLPGNVFSLDDLKQLLMDKRDAVTDPPNGRWSQDNFDPTGTRPGTTYVQRGGYVSGHEYIDTGFFSLSPKEAVDIDPQHRFLLETSFEAIENAGQRLEDLRKHRVGVFAGITGDDYRFMSSNDLVHTSAYSGLGTSSSIAANRISYAYDLHGPSLTVDTACSSGLTALDMAVKSLQSGDCEFAIVGAANALISTHTHAALCAANLLSPYGICRAFDACADGYVRSEGAVSFLLRPARTAVRNRDPILGLILGSGCNSDGRTQGLSRPSRKAQRSLVEMVCSQAQVRPEQIAYLETHGTGTPTGDPEEAAAIGNALGKKRGSGNPLPIGSIKTNIGHTEAVAGLAGLAKALVVLRDGIIVPSIHHTTPNPEIDFHDLNIDMVTEPRPIDPATSVIGVNSFGFGGANAHVIVGKAPTADLQNSPATPTSALMLVSARSKEALSVQAEQLAEHLRENPEIKLGDLQNTLLAWRSWHPHRHAFYASDRDAALSALDAAGQEVRGAMSAHGVALKEADPVFVFCGNGVQWQGMGSQLYADDALFRETIDELGEAFGPINGAPLSEHILAPNVSERMSSTAIAQPALFSIQVALVRWYASQGVRPGAVVGHSVGEVTAAYIAGVIDLPTAIILVRERSALQEATAGKGAMAVAAMSPEYAATLLVNEPDVTIGCRNAPEAVVLAGPVKSVERAIELAQAENVTAWQLELNYGFHSCVMEPLQDDFVAHIGEPALHEARLPMYSTVTGHREDGLNFDSSHWWHNMRSPVLFEDAIGDALKDGHQLFVEIAPHPALAGYVSATARAQGVTVRTVESLRRTANENQCLAKSFLTLVVSGARVDLNQHMPEPVPPLALPLYPWQREHHFREFKGSSSFFPGTPNNHPLLENRLSLAVPAWSAHLTLQGHPELEDHKVRNSILFPGAGFIEIALAATREVHSTGTLVLEQVNFTKALQLNIQKSTELQTYVDLENNTFKIASSTTNLTGDNSDQYAEHAHGMLSCRDVPTRHIDLKKIAGRLTEVVESDEIYAETTARGLHYGDAFQTIQQIRTTGKEALAHLVSRSKTSICQQIDPMLLDGAFQATIGLSVSTDETDLYLPTSIDRFMLFRDTRELEQLYVHIVLMRRLKQEMAFDLTIATDTGEVVASLSGFRVRRVSGGQMKTLYHEHRLVPLANIEAENSKIDFDEIEHLIKASQPSRPATDTSFSDQVLHLTGQSVSRAFWELSGGHPFALHTLVEDGKLASTRKSNAEWLLQNAQPYATVTAGLWTVRPIDQWADYFQALLAEFPDRVSELTVLSLFYNNIQDILNGTTDPDDVFGTLQASQFLESISENDPALVRLTAAIKSVFQTCEKRDDHHHVVRAMIVQPAAPIPLGWLLNALPPGKFEIVVLVKNTQAPQRVARQQGANKNVDFLEWDGLSEIPAVRGSFDAILSLDIEEHDPTEESLLAEFKSCLKKNGIYINALLPARHFTGFVLAACDKTNASDPTRPKQRLAERPEEEIVRQLNSTGFVDARAFLRNEVQEPAGTLILASNPDLPTSGMDLPDDAPCLGNGLRIAITDGNSTLAEALAEACQKVSIPLLTLHVQNDDVSANWQFKPPQKIEAHGEGIEEKLSSIFASIIGQKPVEIFYFSGDRQLDEKLSPDEGWPLVAATKALASAGFFELPSLTIVTEGVFNPPENLSGAAAWAIGRTIVNEQPGWSTRRVDIERNLDSHSQALDLLLYHRCRQAKPGDLEADELVVGARGLQMVQFSDIDDDDKFAKRMLKDGEEFSVVLSHPGAFGNLSFELQSQQTPPGPGEVEISVRALGVNFKDVLLSLGVLPPELMIETDQGFALGFEGAGIVTRSGPGITDFRPGMRVLFCSDGCFTSSVSVDSNRVMALPDGWSFEDAATVPVVGLTVSYALNTLAKLQEGETLLVHGGAGGVGMMAIAYAKAVGARVVATAGSETKRTFLRSIGVDFVCDSRNLSFVASTLDYTNEAGVDIVLNSLPGETMEASLGLLRPGGRFVEIGKRDLLENRRVGLNALKLNISYFAVDIGEFSHSHPKQYVAELQKLTGLIHSKQIRPIPRRHFPISRIEDAFRHLQAGNNIGKVVLTIDSHQISVKDKVVNRFPVAPDGVHIVTGGLGGVGLHVAKWLALGGAQELVLIGRQGIVTDEQRAAIRAIEAEGARVSIHPCDVADLDSLSQVLNDVCSTKGSIRGIVHSVLVLRDAAMVNMSHELYRAPLEAKVLGAQNLHALTQNDALDYFVCLSSASTAIGNPGQANYCAANAIIDAMMAARSTRGQVGFSLAPGALGEIGYLAKSGQEQHYKERFGLLITPDLLTQAIDTFAASKRSYVALLPTDNLGGLKITATPRFQGAVSNRLAAGNRESTGHIDLAALSNEERLSVVCSAIADCFAQVTGLSNEQVNVGEPIETIGLDSLMAMELGFLLEESTGIKLPVAALVPEKSIEDISQNLLVGLDLSSVVKPREDNGTSKTGKRQENNETLTSAEYRPEIGSPPKLAIEQSAGADGNEKFRLFRNVYTGQNPVIRKVFSYAEDRIGSHRMVQGYERLVDGIRLHDNNAADRFIENCGIGFDIQTKSKLETIDTKNGILLVSNHPNGVWDGMFLTAIASRITSSLMILADDQIPELFPPLKPFILPISREHSKYGTQINSRSLEKAADIMRKGGLIVVFPSGDAAHATPPWSAPKELPWHPAAGTLTRVANPTILPIHITGQLPWYYHAGFSISRGMGDFAQRIASLRFAGKKITLKIGEPIARDQFHHADDASTVTGKLREIVMSLGSEKTNV